MDVSGATRPFEGPIPEVTIIVPARNEEASLADCLQSLVTQTGVNCEIIVVDDASTDRTREIAEGFAVVQANARVSVRVISPGPLPPGWTGKNNAAVAGANVAQGEWLLFTDADTVHLPGSLARALAEAKQEKADLQSYSPEQVAVTFWEMSGASSRVCRAGARIPTEGSFRSGIAHCCRERPIHSDSPGSL